MLGGSHSPKNAATWPKAAWLESMLWPTGSSGAKRAGVPCFYFNFGSGSEFAEGEEGFELADFEAAHAQAVEGLRGIVASDLLDGTLNTAAFVEIEDEQRNLIATVFFEEVVKLREEPHSKHSAAVIASKRPD